VIESPPRRFKANHSITLRPGLRRTGMEGIVAIHFKVESRLVTILSITYHGRRYQPNR
jgi:hypothetical protein